MNTTHTHPCTHENHNSACLDCRVLHDGSFNSKVFFTLGSFSTMDASFMPLRKATTYEGGVAESMNDTHTLQVRTPAQPCEVHMISITNAHTSCPMYDTPMLVSRNQPVLRCSRSCFTLMGTERKQQNQTGYVRLPTCRHPIPCPSAPVLPFGASWSGNGPPTSPSQALPDTDGGPGPDQCCKLLTHHTSCTSDGQCRTPLWTPPPPSRQSYAPRRLRHASWTCRVPVCKCYM